MQTWFELTGERYHGWYTISGPYIYSDGAFYQFMHYRRDGTPGQCSTAHENQVEAWKRAEEDSGYELWDRPGRVGIST